MIGKCRMKACTEKIVQDDFQVAITIEHGACLRHNLNIKGSQVSIRETVTDIRIPSGNNKKAFCNISFPSEILKDSKTKTPNTSL